MAKIVTFTPRLELTKDDAILLETVLFDAVCRYEHDAEYTEKRAAEVGDVLVAKDGTEISRSVMAKDYRERALRCEALRKVISDIRYMLPFDDDQRGGGESCMKSCSSPRNGEPS